MARQSSPLVSWFAAWFRRPNFPVICWFASIEPVVCHIHGANPELPVTDRHQSKSLRDLTKSSPLDLREEKVRDPISCTDSQSICIEWRNWSIPWPILGKRVHGSSHFIYDVPHPDDPHTMSMSARRRKGTIAPPASLWTKKRNHRNQKDNHLYWNPFDRRYRMEPNPLREGLVRTTKRKL